jgi:predicted metalloprotease with PDZ domain
MDSPVELADVRVTRFTVPQNTGPAARFRLVAHSDVSQADLDEFAGPVARLVREEIAVIGALPPFEPGEYTFLLDFEPWVEEDGMEHRNSTVITSAGGSIGTSEGRSRALEAMAHEFFHLWNVERLRPAGLEPFDFSRENVTCCLWLAEGFTQYYGDLLLTRAGLADDAPVDAAAAVLMSPGRLVRTPVEMSEHAAFIDEAVSTDPDDRSRTFLSYYTGGEALALALDLSLRGMSSGRLSLDAYMRRLWERFGAPADPRPGYVARPYTLADLRRELAGLTGDPAFAGQFFDRYVEGHEVPDFAALLDQAGFEVQKSAPGRGWAGPVLVTDVPVGVIVGADRTGALLALVPFGTPLYEAGVDEGDTIVTIDGRTATAALWAGLRQRPPGTTVRLGVRRRDGALRETTVTLREDPSIRIVPIERLGRVPTPAQAAFRAAWLRSGI